MRTPSKLERKFLLYWKGVSGPALVSEHQFHPTRKWRFDFAIPSIKLAIEVEGGIWSGGAHTRGKGYSEDCEKYNAAQLLDWTVFRLTDKHIKVAVLEPIAAHAHGILLMQDIFAKEAHHD